MARQAPSLYTASQRTAEDTAEHTLSQHPFHLVTAGQEPPWSSGHVGGRWQQAQLLKSHSEPGPATPTRATLPCQIVSLDLIPCSKHLIPVE